MNELEQLREENRELRRQLERQQAFIRLHGEDFENAWGWYDSYHNVDNYLLAHLGGDFVADHELPCKNTVASIRRLENRAERYIIDQVLDHHRLGELPRLVGKMQEWLQEQNDQ